MWQNYSSLERRFCMWICCRLIEESVQNLTRLKQTDKQIIRLNEDISRNTILKSNLCFKRIFGDITINVKGDFIYLFVFYFVFTVTLYGNDFVT